MQISGKWIVLTLLGLALAAAGGSVWYQHQATRRSLDYWGRSSIALISQADQVELQWLRSPTEVTEPSADEAINSSETPVALCSLVVDDQRLDIWRTVDLSDARGLIHLRTALLSDVSYHWDQPPEAGCSPTWDAALRFFKDDREVTLLFCYDCKSVRQIDGAQVVVMSDKLASGVESYFQESLAPGEDNTLQDTLGD